MNANTDRTELSTEELAKRADAIKAAAANQQPAEQPAPKPAPKKAAPKKAAAKKEATPAAKKAKRYDEALKITVNFKAMPPKRNGRNPYAHYKTGQTIGQILKNSAGAVLMADFWWDSAYRPENEKFGVKKGVSVITIHRK